MKVIPDDVRSICIKRFNLPVTIVDDCPSCKRECRTRFDGDDYISYPSITEPERIYLRCDPCRLEWKRSIRILFSVHAVEEPPVVLDDDEGEE